MSIFNNHTEAFKRGKLDFLRGVRRYESPIDGRTHANMKCVWEQGWDAQSKIKCKGIELADGNFTGCNQEFGDCPTCGK